MAALTLAVGLVYYPDYLNRTAQAGLLAQLEGVFRAAAPFTPRMPRTAKPFSVRMTNCGELGWVSDESGYRYQPMHPVTGERWPPIPDILLKAWAELAAYPPPPEACLVNLYDDRARMGLHQDRDEEDLDAPVVSLSLGNTALFRIGGLERNSPTRSIRLNSGDAIVFGGASRLIFHGVDRIIPDSSRLLLDQATTRALLPAGGRINLTLRRVTQSRA
ncbi:alpha-ketoglutarate-dependent dioxygenase AlkB [Microvirga massiliensis]|uniref:alpha-ketoglutarate-dependent dioxygenase AlkB n=1 Tax=Microvirga massiliensis TaxID=1033741 RepID=UPI00062BA2E2|nr:alpha-ketoglutarate-dependent dioxygenase AlkB [Microvirga massiliensis]